MSETAETQTFGTQARDAARPQDLLDLEEAAHKGEFFDDVDDLLGEIVVRSFCGKQVLQIDDTTSPLSLVNLSPVRLSVLGETFAVDNQHRHGVWYIPEQVTIKVGLQNLSWYFATVPRFATGLAVDSKIRLSPAASAAAVLAWSATEPLFEALFVPFDLRGRSAGTKEPGDQQAAWECYDTLTGALGLDIEESIASMRYGAGWGRLRAPEQLAVKQGVLAALAAQASPDLAARYRAHRLQALISHYYEKAKGGVARRKLVVTKAFQRDLSAFFGGDWLRFLDYLGEAPHPEEQIESALPEVKLMVSSSKSAAFVAESLGLPPEEVERALSSYWGDSNAPKPSQMSPVEERVTILTEYWQHFDEAHARQAPGMKPLWGLVQEGPNESGGGWQGPEWYSPGLYRALLPADLLGRIAHAWGTEMLARWPEHIVTNLSPHGAMADAFGPALTFWHDVGLTAWFVSEGPYARTDMAGLTDYYAARLSALADLGCPVDPAVFEDLIAAENQLGPAEAITEEHSVGESSTGLLKFTMSSQIGARRSGFEGLRDVVTRVRRAWAERYLETYLKALWDAEIREAARLYFQLMANRQKAPTPKQFARHAADATNHWFGGDLSLFYGAIGEKSPFEPTRVSLVPADPKAFVNQLFTDLGGKPSQRKRLVADRAEYEENSSDEELRSKFHWLANQSLHFIQLTEAIGRPPEVSQFGRQSFEYRSDVLDEDHEVAWQRYVSAIQAALTRANDPTEIAPDASVPSSAPESGAPPPPQAPSAPPLPPPQTQAPPPPQASTPQKRRRWFSRER